jgi:HD superfamily phosphohydrolase
MTNAIVNTLANSESDKPSNTRFQMALRGKPQRIRDPIHNLIEFGGDQFEQTMWNVIETRPFQRLRRVRQLGFSDFVFPGATHTRFAHSIGVFHTARLLIQVISKAVGGTTHQANVALAAALVHDVGHGMFSHAFETVGKKLNLPMASHENVSNILIRDSEIKEALNKTLGRGFSEEVAEVVKNKTPSNVFDSAVSSQFDADRLDYLQRDRMMTGVHGSGVDVTWLIANLELASVPVAVDEVTSDTVDTLVLGPKAFFAAEHYVLSLFHMYPNVYFHKTTRGIEKLFAFMLLRINELIAMKQGSATGLPERHPIYRFFRDPNSLEAALDLDDTVFWGALSFLTQAEDKIVSECALRLVRRKLLKCIDIRRKVEANHPLKPGMSTSDLLQRTAQIDLKIKQVMGIGDLASTKREGQSPILLDEYRRSLYNKVQDSDSPLNKILVKTERGPEDMATLSSVVSNADSFELNRVYVDKDVRVKYFYLRSADLELMGRANVKL